MKNTKFILASLTMLLTLSFASFANISSEQTSAAFTTTIDGIVIDNWGDPVQGVQIILELKYPNDIFCAIDSQYTESAGEYVYYGLANNTDYCVRAVPNSTFSSYTLGEVAVPNNRGCFNTGDAISASLGYFRGILY